MLITEIDLSGTALVHAQNRSNVSKWEYIKCYVLLQKNNQYTIMSMHGDFQPSHHAWNIIIQACTHIIHVVAYLSGLRLVFNCQPNSSTASLMFH